MTTYTEILPRCINYCLDSVNEVRVKSAKYSSKILHQLITSLDREIKIKSLRILEAFAFSLNQIYRQS